MDEKESLCLTLGINESELLGCRYTANGVATCISNIFYKIASQYYTSSKTKPLKAPCDNNERVEHENQYFAKQAGTVV
jgi:hypothetical protein